MPYYHELFVDRILNGMPSAFSHARLIRDSNRGSLYKGAIFSTFRSGYIVLDIGNETGILSYYAAEAGA